MKNLKIVLIVICVLIILLLGGNIALFVIQQNNSAAENELTTRLETVSFDLSNYVYPPKDQRDNEEYIRIEKELKSIINESKNQDTTTRANVSLALLYFYKDDSADRSIEFLDSVLENNVLSDQNKYAILNTKLGFYTESNDTKNIQMTLQEILKLPETMELPSEDWSATRKYYTESLKQLED